ncbi:MAG: gamma-glutamylcyclotransferase [Rhodobacteraceae bacterium]|nr:gamma-glutamylcyclotransferase [Paracoccaceae bacterium]
MPSRTSRRPIALTADHVDRVYREVPDPGPSSTHTPMTDQDKEDLARRLLDENAGRPFWVFAYGSLIWKPAFEYDERRPCLLHGWHRSFCLDMNGWRATPEQPGLMLALDNGGACNGVGFKMPEDDQMGRMIRLIEREGAFLEMIPWIRWVTLRANGESFRGLAFYCTPPTSRRHKGEARLIRLPIEDQVHRLARAVGHAGSCAEYLFNTVTHLEQLGIHDSYMWKLQKLVADEIDAVHGSTPEAGQGTTACAAAE